MAEVSAAPGFAAAQRIGLQLRQPALTGLAEAAEFDAKRLPDAGMPSWLVSAASPCWAARMQEERIRIGCLLDPMGYSIR
jgi:hypothetical protein